MVTVALASWPIITLVLFAVLDKRDALIWSLVCGYLLLPEDVGIDLPILPQFDKFFVASMSALFAAFAFRPKQTFATRKAAAGAAESQDSSRFFGVTYKILIAFLVIGPLATYFVNQRPIIVAESFRPGLEPWDAFTTILNTLIALIPFFLARKYLATRAAHERLLAILVLAGLAYSLLIMFEVRMSPQLNRIVYGYFQHSWTQHLRGDGFRPLVFLRHGLWLGFFILSVILAAICLFRHKTSANEKILYVTAGLWMFVVLSFSRNLGAMLLAFCFVPVVFVLPALWQMRIAALVACMFMAYPMARQAGVVPTGAIVSAAAKVDAERAGSLQFRLDQEDALLARALEKPLTGWGAWGRNRVFDERGRDSSVTDGIWIIVLGEGGWLRFLGYFGLLTMPLLMMMRAARRKKIGYPTAGLSIIMAANLAYMIPNSTLSPIGWLIAGALAGFAQFDEVTRKSDDEQADKTPRGTRRYSRYPPKQRGTHAAPS